MEQMKLDMMEYTQTARAAVAEGQVLLHNEGSVLPLPSDAKLAVFGRMQFHYYKSGTGSGGMVNVDSVTGILDALQLCPELQLNQKLMEVYREWEKENPFNEGVGWGKEPWSQVEMPLTDEVCSDAAAESEYALAIIARTAGEDKDNQNLPGSYQLSEAEEDMLKRIRKFFKKVIVVLNVGNIIDMSFVNKYRPDAVLYAWQGGMIGGLGTADILTGAVSPSGKLTDTIACKIEDYPSDKNFGNLDETRYEEDIYVGYRYFETVAKDRVLYPFGFGLSYTEFQILVQNPVAEDGLLTVDADVTNCGTVSGKEVVQVYIQAPQGKLGKPTRVLAGFAKTGLLAAGEKEHIKLRIPYYDFASYDENGVTGYTSSYVLEKGEYVVWVGSSVRDAKEAGRFLITDTELLAKCSQAMAPIKQLTRMKPTVDNTGSYFMTDEDAPCAKMTPGERRMYNLPEELDYTGDKGYKLSDVKNGKVSMEDFIAQLADEDLACIIRGEGMGSPKVTPGTAAAFGGVSKNLAGFGIPCGCASDGPSGMRLDSGVKAFSLPNGTLLACTFNTELMEKLFSFTGVEMVKNRIDTLLGPGMNIHRHPLNGRNFEYFSEDPLLTGRIASAQIKGLRKSRVTGTIKHFCANNQETSRHDIDCVISERALREIYLKGYEIAIKEGGGNSVMTTYGSVNGLWTAGNYDLNTLILRQEWGFKGISMTDWRAKINEPGVEASKTNFAAMAKAQNDLYMVCQQAETDSPEDNTMEELQAGRLCRGELQRNAMNICQFMLDTRAFDRFYGDDIKVEVIGGADSEDEEALNVKFQKVGSEIIIPLDEKPSDKKRTYVLALDLENLGVYNVELTGSSDLGELAQMSVTLIYQSVPFAVFTYFGTEGKWVTIQREVALENKYAVLRLVVGQNGLNLKQIKFTFEKEQRNFW